MERVAIVGSGGAGKSTWARALAERSGLPLTHLDHHFWRPGWVEIPRDEWRVFQAGLVAEPRWILDGNYGGTLDIRLPAADTVFIFGIHHARCTASVIARTLRNHGKAVQAEGCPERFKLEFLRYVWTYPKKARVRLDNHIAAHGSHLRIVEFKTRDEAWRYLETL